MILRLGLYKTPKQGSSESEYEDAYYPIGFPSKSPCPFVCAIGDGATETSFSGLWANLVTEAYYRANGSLEVFIAGLGDIRSQWHKETSSKPLPWYAEQKLAKGAFATLLGLTIKEDSVESGEVNWCAHAIGDSCLFHARSGNCIATFPASKSEELSANPMLLCSISRSDDDVSGLILNREGRIVAGDRLYLVTDALAGWILRGLEREEKPLDVLDQAIKTTGGMVELMESLRESKAIKNDDCTLIWVEVIT